VVLHKRESGLFEEEKYQINCKMNIVWKGMIKSIITPPNQLKSRYIDLAE